MSVNRSDLGVEEEISVRLSQYPDQDGQGYSVQEGRAGQREHLPVQDREQGQSNNVLSQGQAPFAKTPLKKEG